MRSPQPLLVPLLVLTLLASPDCCCTTRSSPGRLSRYGVPALRRSSFSLLGVLGLLAYPVLGGLAVLRARRTGR